MAAEISEITDSNHEDLRGYLDHILTDLHAVLKELDRQGSLTDKHDRLLEEFRPLLNQFRSPAAAGLALRRARRISNGNRD